jgi:hypothetical protein
MAPNREDVREWIGRLDGQIREHIGQQDIRARLAGIRDGFQALLGAPFVDGPSYGRLCGEYYGVQVDLAAREFSRSSKRRSERVVLDTDESVLVISQRSRRDGESDLAHERATQRVEEAYLFIRQQDARGAFHDTWVEVGNREQEDTASISPFQVAGILKHYSESGRIVEASLYHYHPDSPGEALPQSRVSMMDLMVAAKLYEVLGTSVQTPIDFRVVNPDGIYTFYGATFERLRAMDQVDMYRVNALSGRELIQLLGRYGIGCEFEPASRPRTAQSQDASTPAARTPR